jgi:hypothetical protein
LLVLPPYFGRLQFDVAAHSAEEGRKGVESLFGSSDRVAQAPFVLVLWLVTSSIHSSNSYFNWTGVF